MSSPISSPPSSPSSPSPNTNLSTQLDSEIARLNAQISSIRQQKQYLSQTLLASSTVRNIIKARKSSQGDSAASNEQSTYHRLVKAVEKQQIRNEIKVYRLANNVTTFPFKDPAPERFSDPSMLGLRFELPFTRVTSSSSTTDRDTANEEENETQKVYLVMLRRVLHRGKTYLQLQTDMNQIPKHIDVEGFAARYLPVPELDDAEMSSDSNNGNEHGNESFQDDSGIDVTQDLNAIINGASNNNLYTTTTAAAAAPSMNGAGTGPGTVTQPIQVDISETSQSLRLFATTTRNALLSWHYRTSYISHLIASLSLSSSTDLGTTKSKKPRYKHHITRVTSNPPSTHLEIDWDNGATAILWIDDAGKVGIVTAFGPRLGVEDERVENQGDGDGGKEAEEGTYRCYSVERLLKGLKLSEVMGGLERVGGLMNGVPRR